MTDRRKFLSLIAAAPVLAAVPAISAAEQVTPSGPAYAIQVSRLGSHKTVYTAVATDKHLASCAEQMRRILRDFLAAGPCNRAAIWKNEHVASPHQATRITLTLERRQ